MANILGSLWLTAISKIGDLVSSEKNPIKSLDSVFKLHCHITFTFLVLASGLLQLVKFAGTNIDCYAKGSDLAFVANTHCWISGTFILKTETSWTNKTLAAGLGYDTCDSFKRDGCKFWLGFYQWTAWVLLLQAFAFYIPRWLWWNFEIGFLGSLVQSFSSLKDPKNAVERKKIESLCGDLLNQRSYFFFVGGVYIWLEFLNFCNCVGQIFFLDFFFGHFSIVDSNSQQHNELHFTNFGWAMLDYMKNGLWGDGQVQFSPGNSLFPRMSKCDISLLGIGGAEQKEQFLCFLLLNNINEKIFLILWFWLHALAIVAALKLLVSVVSATFCSSLGNRRLRSNCQRTREDMVDMQETTDVKGLLKRSSDLPFGVIFVLHIVKRNASHRVFKEVLIQTLLLVSTKDKQT